MERAPYHAWSSEKLVARISDLEAQLKAQNEKLAQLLETPSSQSMEQKRKGNPLNPDRYSTRFIALKFAYLGRNLNGYEHPGNTITPLPSVEEELWKALMKTRLIFPKVKRKVQKPRVLADGSEEVAGEGESQEAEVYAEYDGAERIDTAHWDGCEYSKCGRTDKGVSSFGQVIGIRVRSNMPLSKQPQPKANDTIDPAGIVAEGSGKETERVEVVEEEKPFDPINDEIPYIHVLNQVLPPEIRVLAWCPTPPPDFSARFSCRERRYKYFFTNPAYLPVPGTEGSTAGQQPNGGAWLDIEKMKEAANYFLGSNDFRNFAKMDPARQLTNFERIIFHVDIEEISSLDDPGFLASGADPDAVDRGGLVNQGPKVYAFVVHGSAFLYNQVRHMAAILFLVGQGLEEPTIVKELLDVAQNPRKPKYEIASDAPLVLWDCVFPGENANPREDSLHWVYADHPSNVARTKSSIHGGKWGIGGLMDTMWSTWRSRKIDEIHAAQLLQVTALQGRGLVPQPVSGKPTAQAQKSVKTFDGGDSVRPKGVYTPVMKRPLLETPEEINAKWAAKKGLTPAQATKAPRLDDADE